MPLRRALLLPLPLLLSVGCVTPAPVLPKTSMRDEKVGYVGGIFERDTVAKFGFDVRNLTTREVWVLPVLKKDVGIVALPAGTYRVESWEAFAAVGNGLIVAKDIPEASALGRRFELAPGEVVLIGKWLADRIVTLYELTPIPLTEAQAVAAFRDAYPNFADAPARCIYCLR